MPDVTLSRGKTLYIDIESLGEAIHKGSRGGLACAFFWDSSIEGDAFWRAQHDAKGEFSPEAKAALRRYMRLALRAQNLKKGRSNAQG